MFPTSTAWEDDAKSADLGSSSGSERRCDACTVRVQGESANFSASQSKVPDTEWTTFNPLKTIWFCYNTHFPQIPARVYSGLVFNGLIDIETRCLGKTNITFSHWLKNSYMRRTHWGYWSSALSETAWIHMKDFCVVPFWIELASQTCHMIFLHALNWLKLLEWVQCGTKSPQREGKILW